MSDKLQLKGNVIVSDPDIDDWFAFETNVLKAIKKNPSHTIDAVCEVKSFSDSEIMDSHKVTGKMTDWTTFAPKAFEMQKKYPDYSVSCTVALRAGKKGKHAQKAFDNNQLDMFSTAKVEDGIDDETAERDDYGRLIPSGVDRETGEVKDLREFAKQNEILLNGLKPDGDNISSVKFTHVRPDGAAREVELKAK